MKFAERRKLKKQKEEEMLKIFYSKLAESLQGTNLWDFFTNGGKQRESDDKQRESDDLKRKITDTFNLVGIDNYNTIITDLYKLYDEAIQKNLLEISDLAKKYINEACSKKLKENLKHSNELIESSNYDEAIENLKKIVSEALQYNLIDISEPAKKLLNQANTLKILSQMFKASKRLKIDDICDQIDLPRKEIIKLFFTSATKFGIKLDGDYVIVENTDNLNSMVLNSLEEAFKDWNQKEETKDGKLE